MTGSQRRLRGHSLASSDSAAIPEALMNLHIQSTGGAGQAWRSYGAVRWHPGGSHRNRKALGAMGTGAAASQGQAWQGAQGATTEGTVLLQGPE